MREPRPDWSPFGVNFKILDEHPYLFIYRVPPSPGFLRNNSVFFFPAKFTAEDIELLRLFEIESAAKYRQRVEEEKRTGTEERIRKTSERWVR